MSYSVYLESSVVDLKPSILGFLNALLEKAKEAKDYVISSRQKDIAEWVGKDTRTVSRYLKELEEKNIIQMKGRKGRGGGTVILFNTELIKFNTSDKALINSDNPEDIDELMEKHFPKKKQEEDPNKKKRKRRTKKQMVESRILARKRDNEIKKLNEKVVKLGGVPNWDWFKETDDPVGNYRTYLLSRLYNRYAVLFTDRHNAEVEVYGKGNKVARVSNDYDVLPMEFYGTPRWTQFEKLRIFLEENDIDPAVYLSAQFSRSVFDSAKRKSKNVLPFVNALISETSHEVYKQYCDYQKQVSYTYAAYQVIPARFSDDFVVRAIVEAYETAHTGNGLLGLKHAIYDFLEGLGSTDKDDTLLDFIDLTDKNLRKQNVSFKTRNTLKKYLMLQTLTLTGGITRLPNYVILGSEITRAALVSIDNQMKDSKDEARKLKALALGMFTHPNSTQEEQLEKGYNYLYQYSVLHETPQLLNLIMERKGLYIGIKDIMEALKEYGRDKIPVDDYSVLNVEQVVSFMDEKVYSNEYLQEEEPTKLEINHEDITEKDYVLTGSVATDDPLVDAFNSFLEEDKY